MQTSLKASSLILAAALCCAAQTPLSYSTGGGGGGSSVLQPSTPGTPQTGNINVSGVGIFGNTTIPNNLNGTLGTAAIQNIGASGATLCLLNANCTFSGTVSGITATMVGLGNVTNNAQLQLSPGIQQTGNSNISGVGIFGNTTVPATLNGTLGTASLAATGTSGATVPLLNGANTYSAAQTIGLLLGPAEYTGNGTCATAATINWANGYNQTLTLTASDTCALTFTQPSSAVASIRLRIIGPASGTGQISGGYWPSGAGFTTTAPTLSNTGSTWAFAVCVLNGTETSCQVSQ